MRLDGLGRRGEEVGGPLREVDARWKLLATVVYVVLVVATPPAWWRVLAAEALALALVVGYSGARPWGLFRRWLGFASLVGTLALMAASGHPDRASLGLGGVAGAILARNSLAFVAMMVLVEVTPFRLILAAMGRLGMPRLLVATLRFMERQAQILADDLGRMVQARRSRTFGRGGRIGVGRLAGLVAMLLLRSFERGERVHAAMLARGWDGTVRTLDGVDDR